MLIYQDAEVCSFLYVVKNHIFKMIDTEIETQAEMMHLPDEKLFWSV